MPAIKLYSILLLGIICISFASIFVRFCEDVPSLMIATYRLTIAATILILYGVTKKDKKEFKISKKDFFLCLISGCFLSLHFILWFISLKLTSVASSVVLVTTSPIFLGIISFFILKTKLPPSIAFSIAISFIGTVLIATSDSNVFSQFNLQALTGDILALTGGLMSCLYLLIGSFQRKKQTTFAYILYVYASSAILLTILSLLFNVPFTGYKTQSYVFMILLAIVSQLTGHSCFNWALKHFRVESVAIVILGEPIGASILAYFIFKESIDTLQLAGIALILWAIRISTKRGIIIN